MDPANRLPFQNAYQGIKYPPNSTITKLDSTLEIKQAWLYSEWEPKCQFSHFIRSYFPNRNALDLANPLPDVRMIKQVFDHVRGKYDLWKVPRENGRWKKLEVPSLSLDWVRNNVEVLYPVPDRFAVSELRGIVLWKEPSSSGKRYKLFEGNHRISAWLAAQTPQVLPATIYIGKPQKQPPVEAVQAEQVPALKMPECISVKEFKTRFKNADRIYTCDYTHSDEGSISSMGVGDCITVFGKNKNETGKIKSIFGCHFDFYTDDFLIKDGIKKYLDETEKVGFSAEVYIIGGNEDADSNQCLDCIRKSIKELQADYSIKILGEFINLNKGTDCDFIDANFQMDGTLTFCRYIGV